MLSPYSGFVGVSVLNADIPPTLQHILGAMGAQAFVAGRIRVAFAARDGGNGEVRRGGN